MMFFIVLFIVLVGGGWLIGKAVGTLFFGETDRKSTFVDRSINVHHHYHDNRSLHMDGEEFKSLKK